MVLYIACNTSTTFASHLCLRGGYKPVVSGRNIDRLIDYLVKVVSCRKNTCVIIWKISLTICPPSGRHDTVTDGHRNGRTDIQTTETSSVS